MSMIKRPAYGTRETKIDRRRQKEMGKRLEKLTGFIVMNNHEPKGVYDFQFIEPESGITFSIAEFKYRITRRLEAKEHDTAYLDHNHIWVGASKTKKITLAAKKFRLDEDSKCVPLTIWNVMEGMFFAMAEFYPDEWIQMGGNRSRKAEGAKTHHRDGVYCVPVRHLVYCGDLRRELIFRNSREFE